MKKRRIWAFILAFLLLFTPFKPLPLARAEAQMVVTLGADLSEEQKQEMFRYFGVTEDQVTVIMITNQDEREQLGNLIPLEVIGSHTYSCHNKIKNDTKYSCNNNVQKDSELESSRL